MTPGPARTLTLHQTPFLNLALALARQLAPFVAPALVLPLALALALIPITALILPLTLALTLALAQAPTLALALTWEQSVGVVSKRKGRGLGLVRWRGCSNSAAHHKRPVVLSKALAKVMTCARE